MTERKQRGATNQPAVLPYQLDSMYLTLGQSVMAVEEMRGALKKDVAEEIRVAATHIKEGLRKLQRLQRELLEELERVGVLGRRAQPKRTTGRRVSTSVPRRKPPARR